MQKSRIKKLLQILNKQKQSSILLVETAPSLLQSFKHIPFKQDTDFFYLTGSKLQKSFLLISNKKKNGILIANQIDQLTETWIGKQESPKTIAKKLNLDLKLVKPDDLIKTISNEVKNHQNLYFNPIPGSISSTLLSQINNLNEVERFRFPKNFLSSRDFIAQLRLIKDSSEIKLIKKAIDITKTSLAEMQELIATNVKEKDLAAFLEYRFKVNGADTNAFPSIVAAGKNAAVLHYEKLESKLKRTDVLLVDCGASYQGYSADITRCFPVCGEFVSPYDEIYQIVLSAQRAAIKKIKDGVSFKSVQTAAVRELTVGLKELGVLKGNLTKLINKKAYFPYFMHGIGHSLGLDTHDPGGHREGNAHLLKRNMVFTIEPGLYFSQKTKHILAGGIRIEDDILVRTNDCKVLS